MGLKRLAKHTRNKPLEGYQVAAVRKIGRKTKDTASKATQWAKDNPEQAALIATTVGIMVAKYGRYKAVSNAQAAFTANRFTMTPAQNTTWKQAGRLADLTKQYGAGSPQVKAFVNTIK